MDQVGWIASASRSLFYRDSSERRMALIVLIFFLLLRDSFHKMQYSLTFGIVAQKGSLATSDDYGKLALQITTSQYSSFPPKKGTIHSSVLCGFAQYCLASSLCLYSGRAQIGVWRP